MDTFQAVKTMLAVRRYEDRPISDEDVRPILEAGRLTGSSKNLQHWDFIAIRDRERLRQLGGIARTGSYIGDAALAIAVVVPDRTIGYIDGARAAQDMMLVAWERGIGSNWVGNVNTDAVRERLQVPEGRMVLTIIPFGYPAQKIADDVQKDRKPMAEIAHAEVYGRPYEG